MRRKIQQTALEESQSVDLLLVMLGTVSKVTQLRHLSYMSFFMYRTCARSFAVVPEKSQSVREFVGIDRHDDDR